MRAKTIFIGADLGNVYCKFVSGPKNQGLFSSHACPAVEEDIETDAGDLLDNLTVNIRYNGREELWFVGEKAHRVKSAREFRKEKAARRNIIPLLLTGIALSAEDVFVEPRVVVGLPISHYKQQAGQMEDILVGTYEVRLPGKQVHIDIKPGNVLAAQECYMVAFDQILGWHGEVVRPDLAKKIIGISDPGWKTWNIAVMNRLRPEPAACHTFNNTGFADAYTDFMRRAAREYDLRPFELEERFNILGRPEIEALAERWENLASMFPFWSEPRASFDVLYLAGGGEGFKNPETGKLCFKNYDFTLLPEAQFANARAFYKVAKMKLGGK